MLKEIPIGSQFTMTCVEPRKAFGWLSTRDSAPRLTRAAEAIAPRGQLPPTNQDVKAGGGKKTLRIKSGGTATIEDEACAARRTHSTLIVIPPAHDGGYGAGQ